MDEATKQKMALQSALFSGITKSPAQNIKQQLDLVQTTESETSFKNITTNANITKMPYNREHITVASPPGQISNSSQNYSNERSLSFDNEPFSSPSLRGVSDCRFITEGSPVDSEFHTRYAHIDDEQNCDKDSLEDFMDDTPPSLFHSGPVSDEFGRGFDNEEHEINM
jgi:hypothetical protein